MRELKKQDRTSSRLPTDTERKYKLGQIELTAEEVEQLKSELVVDEYLSITSSNAIANKTVTNALNNKVTKEANKGLSSNDFTDEYKNKVDNLVEGGTGGAGISILDAYPVGSIYMSVNSTNPATLFGGEWEQLEDRFLLGASSNYEAGSTGGEATHTLTIDEMPSHSHSGGFRDYSGVTAVSSATSLARPTTSSNLYDTTREVTLSTGGGQAHNNMPPYLAVYMWKRIS